MTDRPPPSQTEAAIRHEHLTNILATYSARVSEGAARAMLANYTRLGNIQSAAGYFYGERGVRGSVHAREGHRTACHSALISCRTMMKEALGYSNPLLTESAQSDQALSVLRDLIEAYDAQRAGSVK